MPPAAGTAAQLSRTLGIPKSTIYAYAKDGDLTLVDRILVGRRWTARYDGRQLVALSHQRHRRNGAAELRLARSILTG